MVEMVREFDEEIEKLEIVLSKDYDYFTHGIHSLVETNRGHEESLAVFLKKLGFEKLSSPRGVKYLLRKF